MCIYLDLPTTARRPSARRIELFGLAGRTQRRALAIRQLPSTAHLCGTLRAAFNILPAQRVTTQHVIKIIIIIIIASDLVWRKKHMEQTLCFNIV